jgi:hypothetical protein
MKTANHKSNVRERMNAPSAPSSRSERRKEARKEARAARKAYVRARMDENHRLVRFAF